ncbi:MAG: NAD-dependent protein deacylase, partial [Candidatus Omnitrophica bacterium]|nr:NAD-dependent protein deacylase [Candidatus Omnitrophota bacterium]
GIDPHVVQKAEAATRCDLFFTIGTSAVVFPAADLIFQAQRHGATVIEINPEKTPASSRVDLFLQGNSEIVLDRIEALLG